MTLDSLDSDWVTEIISARTFISLESGSKKFTDTCNQFDILWIATTPKSQILILQKLQNTQTKIILEKPIATNKNEIVALLRIVNECHCKIYLSEPWTFSNLWGKTKEILLSIEGVITLQTERGGNFVRKAFPPELDWAPHDLYLLVDYAKMIGVTSSQIELISRDLKENRIRLKYSIGSERIFEIVAGALNSRKAVWKINSNVGLKADLNFETRELTAYIGEDPVKSKFDTDNPITKMLTAFSEIDPDVDWDLIFRLYGDLVGDKLV